MPCPRIPVMYLNSSILPYYIQSDSKGMQHPDMACPDTVSLKPRHGMPPLHATRDSHIRSYHQNHFAKYLEVINPICLNHKRFHCVVGWHQENVTIIASNVL